MFKKGRRIAANIHSIRLKIVQYKNFSKIKNEIRNGLQKLTESFDKRYENLSRIHAKWTARFVLNRFKDIGIKWLQKTQNFRKSAQN
jgi:hypothetical protein